jgi:hypothetical protein
MAQPNAEPVEDYEYVAAMPYLRLAKRWTEEESYSGADTATVMNRSRPTSRWCRTWLPARSPVLPSTAQVGLPPSQTSGPLPRGLVLL